MKKLILPLIRFYQKTLSMDSGLIKQFFPSRGVCRFTPTCSEYYYQAINKYGILKGSFLGVKRVLHCNPFFEGGQDQVR